MFMTVLCDNSDMEFPKRRLGRRIRDMTTACRQLWIVACPDCPDEPWFVFEERYLRERWIGAHEADLGHFDTEVWEGLSSV